jgi:DNA-binding response OmpR family regulator
VPIRGNYRDHDCGANHESQHFSTQGHGCILPSASTIKNFSTTISHRAPEQWLEEAAPGDQRRREVHLAPDEFELLVYLARRLERVVAHRVLLRAVWRPNSAEQPEYLRAFIDQLRKKI